MARRSPRFILALVACIPALATVTAAAQTPAPASAPVAVFTGNEAPRNWQLLDPSQDGIAGISSERPMKELLPRIHPNPPSFVPIIPHSTHPPHVDLHP